MCKEFSWCFCFSCPTELQFAGNIGGIQVLIAVFNWYPRCICIIIKIDILVEVCDCLSDVLFRVTFVSEPPYDYYYSIFQSSFVLKFNVFVHSIYMSTIFEDKITSNFFGKFFIEHKDDIFPSFFALAASSMQFEPSFIIFDRSKRLFSYCNAWTSSASVISNRN